MVAGRLLMFTSSALSLMTPSLVMVTTGISWALSLMVRTLGTSTSMPNSRTCAVSMKMMSRTRTTSTNGVTLISEIAGLPRLPDRYPPPLGEKAMGYSPKLRSAILRNSSEKSSMRAPSSRIRDRGVAAPARPVPAAIGGEGHGLLSETALGHIEELERKIVHARAQFADQVAEVVIEDGRGDGGEQADGGGDERFGDAGPDRLEAGGAHLGEVREGADNAHHGAHQPEKGSDGSRDGHYPRLPG